MNYSRFKDQLAHTSSRAKRADKLTFAVLLILISEFEALKKKHGNLLMNQLMLAFVERLGTQIREVDTFCRLSEDKFAVLLEDIKEPSNAAIVAARIHIAFETPLKIQDQEIPIKLYVDRVHDHLIENVNAFISRD
jgi:GGDEF domain-containing protein